MLLRDKFFKACDLPYPHILDVHRGFIIGQVEKVFVGACDACMVPHRENLGFCTEVAEIYGLQSSLYEWRDKEVWIHRGHLLFEDLIENTAKWNIVRAQMCGIKDINPEFYNE